MTTPSIIVIVGAGQAGGWAAKTLRAAGYAGRVVLVGAERHLPYERPPLSKAVLAGEAAPETTYLCKPDEYRALDLDFRAQARVARIDRAAKQVELAGGERIAYDQLILATGGSARRLPVPGGNLPGVLYLRTIEDSAAIRAALGPGQRLAVIGGGWIGLEVAATARRMSTSVVVVEALDRVCARSVSREISEFLRARHERAGVELRLGVGVEAIEREDRRFVVRLSDGTALDAGAVLVGIGLDPEVALARAAGLAVDDGIVVDERCRTSDPDIYAAGDCANVPLPCLGRRVRLESWANAQNQAIVAAKAALGQDVRYDELPWFWSDQYDINLQMLGLPARWPQPVVRGDPSSGSFSHFYLDEGRIVAAVSVNAARDLRAAKKLIQTRKPVSARSLADPAAPLQHL
jgi:3-phenylpropionate/trans-cinnamate dioxygenase ferredoxin reductase subunit